MNTEVIHRLLAKDYPLLVLGETARHSLEKYANMDATTTSLDEILSQNQLYEFAVRNYVETRVGKEKAKEIAASTSQCIMLLGVLGVRNFIASARQIRCFGEDWPFFPVEFASEKDSKEKVEKKEKKEGKKFSSEEYIKYAMKAEEVAQSYKVPYAENTAFAGGLFYDWLRRLQEHRSKKNSNLTKCLDEIWRVSLKTAILTARIGGRVKGFSYIKFCFPLALVMGTGKYLIALAALGDDGSTPWFEFEKSCEKIPEMGKREVRMILEKERFGVNHLEVAALAMNYFSIFKPVAPAIHHMMDPYYLRNVQKDLFQLAACLNIANLFIEHKKPAEKGKEPWKSLETNPWFRSLKLKDNDLVEVTKEMSSYSF